MSGIKFLPMITIQRTSAFLANIKQNWLNRAIPETVYFFTFHKCASTLFSSYILNNIEGLQHVDYADQIYSGMRVGRTLDFISRGYVYGPIRLSAEPESLTYKMLVAPTSEHEFIRDKIAIFFVRDPRDILVSLYYSRGYTHGFSPVKEIRERQEIIRKIVQGKSLDEYVLESAGTVSNNFDILNELTTVCHRSVLLKYEDMIDNFEYFAVQLCKYLKIKDTVIKEIYERSRPRLKEDVSSHRRSGQVGGFRSKLRQDTIASVNRVLDVTLKLFKYQT